VATKDAQVAEPKHGRTRSDSRSSSASSLEEDEDEAKRIAKANAAFSQLRTSDFSNADKVPEAWKSFTPPSIKKGHWRSYGPLQARVYSIEDKLAERPSETEKVKSKVNGQDTDAKGEASKDKIRSEKKEKQRIDKLCRKLVSSACEGSAWVTEVAI